MAETAAQILLMALLLATIAWCVLVHRRLGRLRADGGELAAIIAALDAASARAAAVVGELRTVTAEANTRLVERDGAAHQREVELARLIETAARVVRRLESGIGQGVRTLAEARTRADLAPPPEPTPAPDVPVDSVPHGGQRLPDKAAAILEALRGLR
jgi:hypothetical protein